MHPGGLSTQSGNGSHGLGLMAIYTERGGAVTMTGHSCSHLDRIYAYHDKESMRFTLTRLQNLKRRFPPLLRWRVGGGVIVTVIVIIVLVIVIV